MFSVIIPTLNEEKFVGHLLDSLVSQTQKDFEVIVVDGKSKDKTLATVSVYAHKLPKLTVLKSTKALLPHQRNLGAQAATGEWLVFVDADSILMSHFFERFSRFIARDKPKLATTWFMPDSETNGDALITLIGNLIVEASLLLKRPVAPGPLTVVSRQAHEAIGGFDESHRYGEDVDYARRQKEQGNNLVILRETLYSLSLRRLRKEGTLKVLQKFILSVLSVFLIGRTPKYMPGYALGGALYKSRKRLKMSIIKKYQKILKKYFKELFA